MTTVHALLLGLIQGVTEFLPISSSGHLLIAKHIFGIADIPLLYDIALHGATLIVIIVYFRGPIGSLCLAAMRSLRKERRPEHRYIGTLYAKIAISVALTAGAALIVEQIIPLNNLNITACAYTLTGILITITHFINRPDGADSAPTHPNSLPINLPWKIAILTGIAQGIAIAPGISRSGITIAVAILAGAQRKDAFTYSFFIAIPAICGALLLQIIRGVDFSFAHPLSIVGGLLVAIGSGYIGIRFFASLVRTRRQYLFLPYLLFVAIVALILSR